MAVNVISGDFVDCQVDMSLPGVEPFILQRCYHKTDEGKGSLGKSWNLNYDTQVKVDMMDGPNPFTKVTFEQFGGRVTYHVDQVYPNFREVQIDPKCFKKSVTNTGSGLISGKTNLKNQKMIWRKHAEKWMHRDGAGNVKHFEIAKEGLMVEREVRPAGNQVIYRYEKKKLQGVDFANSLESVMASFKLYKIKNGLEVIANNNAKTTYHFEHDLITKVERPNGIWDKYSYRKVTKKLHDQKIHLNLITRKEGPCGSFLNIEYKNYHETDPRLSHRVQTLQQPVVP